MTVPLYAKRIGLHTQIKGKKKETQVDGCSIFWLHLLSWEGCYLAWREEEKECRKPLLRFFPQSPPSRSPFRLSLGDAPFRFFFVFLLMFRHIWRHDAEESINSIINNSWFGFGFGFDFHAVGFSRPCLIHNVWSPLPSFFSLELSASFSCQHTCIRAQFLAIDFVDERVNHKNGKEYFTRIYSLATMAPATTTNTECLNRFQYIFISFDFTTSSTTNCSRSSSSSGNPTTTITTTTDDTSNNTNITGDRSKKQTTNTSLPLLG